MTPRLAPPVNVGETVIPPALGAPAVVRWITRPRPDVTVIFWDAQDSTATGVTVLRSGERIARVLPGGAA